MDAEKQITFLGLTIKTIIVHTITYFIMGLLALTFLEYKTAFYETVQRTNPPRTPAANAAAG